VALTTNPPLSSTEVKGRVELYISPSEPSWSVLGVIFINMHFAAVVRLIACYSATARSEGEFFFIMVMVVMVFCVQGGRI
jgi:hypothetical protein